MPLRPLRAAARCAQSSRPPPPHSDPPGLRSLRSLRTLRLYVPSHGHSGCVRLVGTKTLETKSWLVPKSGGVGFNEFLVSRGWVQWLGSMVFWSQWGWGWGGSNGGLWGAVGLTHEKKPAGCAGNARVGAWADWPVFGCLVK
jgi:hypothetical protein